MQFKMTIYYTTDKHINEDKLMDEVTRLFDEADHVQYDGSYVQLVSVHKRQVAQELANDTHKEEKIDGQE